MGENMMTRPKKRIFLALILISTIITGIILLMTWKIAWPGLQLINAYLPAAFGLVIVLFVMALFAGEAGIVLAILGVPVVKFIYYWAWKAINLLFPFAIGLGRIFNISQQRIQQSFIEVNNHLVKQHRIKVPADRILILTPHCLQRDTCIYKLTRNVENCHQCGACSVGGLIGLCHKYGLHLVVASGGTLARQMVAKARPKAIVAVACERDLTSGIQDVFPIPVLGVFNERPFGPCFNTKVDLQKVEQAIVDFMIDEDKNDQGN